MKELKTLEMEKAEEETMRNFYEEMKKKKKVKEKLRMKEEEVRSWKRWKMEKEKE